MLVTGPKAEPVGRSRGARPGTTPWVCSTSLGRAVVPDVVVEGQRVTGRGARVRQRLDVHGVRVVQVGPAVGRAHAHPHEVGAEVGELRGLVGRGDDRPRGAAGHPVGEVGCSGRGGGRPARPPLS